VGKKNPLAVLAAKLGPLGHGPEFGGFSAAGRSLSRFLLMKNSGVRPPQPGGAAFFNTSEVDVPHLFVNKASLMSE